MKMSTKQQQKEFLRIRRHSFSKSFLEAMSTSRKSSTKLNVQLIDTFFDYLSTKILTGDHLPSTRKILLLKRKLKRSLADWKEVSSCKLTCNTLRTGHDWQYWAKVISKYHNYCYQENSPGNISYILKSEVASFDRIKDNLHLVFPENEEKQLKWIAKNILDPLLARHLLKLVESSLERPYLKRCFCESCAFYSPEKKPKAKFCSDKCRSQAQIIKRDPREWADYIKTQRPKHIGKPYYYKKI